MAEFKEYLGLDDFLFLGESNESKSGGRPEVLDWVGEENPSQLLC